MAVDRELRNSNSINGDADLSDEEFEIPSDEYLVPDILAKKPTYNKALDRVVLIDGLPVIPASKKSKLVDVFFSKFLEKFKLGPLADSDMPMTSDGQMNKGFMFLDFHDDEVARSCVQILNGHKFDKSHTLRATTFLDLERLDKEVEVTEFIPPKVETWVDPGDVYAHLKRDDAVDQLLISYLSDGSPGVYDVEVKWCNGLELSDVRGVRTVRSVRKVSWSPKGRYLACLQQSGVYVYGGEKYALLAKIPHDNCLEFLFSPCDRYMITFKPTSEEKPSINIWNIRPVRQMREFRHEGAMTPFHWSFDGAYFARALPNKLMVYDTTTFSVLDKKGIEIPNLRDFRWSPTDSILVSWCAEQGQSPAQFRVIRLPQKTELRAFNLYNVIGCYISWQPTGSYACIKVDRFKRAVEKKADEADVVKYLGRNATLQILHVLEKNIPVEQIEAKDHVTAIDFEPHGDKFAYISESEQKFSTVHIYRIVAGGNFETLGKLKDRSANTLFWSPLGQFLVIADIKQPQIKDAMRVSASSGPLEFIDTSDMSSLNKSSHHSVTNIEWDPTGRYVATLASSDRNTKTENDLRFHTCAGNQLQQLKQPDFLARCLWRPRPANILSIEQLREAKKTLRHLAPKFEEQDRNKNQKVNAELLETRSSLIKNFRDFVLAGKERRPLYVDEQPKSRQERSGFDWAMMDEDKRVLDIDILFDIQNIGE